MAKAWLVYAIFVDTFPAGSVTDEEMRGIDEYMLATYAGAFNQYFFHWARSAAARRFLTTKDRRFLDFVESQMRSALDGAPPRRTSTIPAQRWKALRRAPRRWRGAGARGMPTIACCGHASTPRWRRTGRCRSCLGGTG